MIFNHLLLLQFLLRDARSANHGIAIVGHLSVHPCGRNADVPWAYRLGFFESNCMNN